VASNVGFVVVGVLGFDFRFQFVFVDLLEAVVDRVGEGQRLGLGHHGDVLAGFGPLDLMIGVGQGRFDRHGHEQAVGLVHALQIGALLIEDIEAHR
jgi:hypothetical protein